jgi:hypothetical protein
MRLFFLVFLAYFPSAISAQDVKWQRLFNGKNLNGWDTWLGPAYDSINGKWGTTSPGLNRDDLKVFSVVNLENEKVIRISGARFGGISTVNEFKNYHLQLKFRWGTEKHAPRKNAKRDSGVLYHAVGNHGADFGFWMRSQEFQVQEGDCGDYWGVAGGSFEIRARKIDSSQFVFDYDSAPLLFNEKSPNGRRCIKNPDAEIDGWNLLEIYCYNENAIHVLNGRVVMILERSGQLDNGAITPLTKGKIQIQSEGAEVYYKDIRLRPIAELPANLLAR